MSEQKNDLVSESIQWLLDHWLPVQREEKEGETHLRLWESSPCIEDVAPLPSGYHYGPWCKTNGIAFQMVLFNGLPALSSPLPSSWVKPMIRIEFDESEQEQ